MISLARTGPESLVMTADSKIQEIRHKLNVWGTLINMAEDIWYVAEASLSYCERG